MVDFSDTLDYYRHSQSDDPLDIRTNTIPTSETSTASFEMPDYVSMQEVVYEEFHDRPDSPQTLYDISRNGLDNPTFNPSVDMESIDWLEDDPPALEGETWMEYATRTDHLNYEPSNDLDIFLAPWKDAAREGDFLLSTIWDDVPTEQNDIKLEEHDAGPTTEHSLHSLISYDGIKEEETLQCAELDNEPTESLRIMFYESSLSCFEMANALSREFYPQKFTPGMVKRELNHIEFEIREVHRATTLWKDWQRSWKKTFGELLWEIDLEEGPNAGGCIHDIAEITALLQERCGIRELRLNADSVAYAVWHSTKKGFLWTAEQRQELRRIFEVWMNGYRWKFDVDLAPAMNEKFKTDLTEDRVKLELDYLIQKNFIHPQDKDECQKRYSFRMHRSSEDQVDSEAAMGGKRSDRLFGGGASQSKKVLVKTEPPSSSLGQYEDSWEGELSVAKLGSPFEGNDVRESIEVDEETSRIVDEFALELQDSSDVDMGTSKAKKALVREDTCETEDTDFTSVCTDDEDLQLLLRHATGQRHRPSYPSSRH